MFVLPPQVNYALRMLEGAGYEAYLVGGAVRDYVRGIGSAKDWDITTNAEPLEVKDVFSDYHIIETGLKHGTITVMISGEPLELTTYRVDGEYSDHRRPDEVHFTRSLREDLERRDFTMNALAYNPSIGVVDYHGGSQDIADGVVRCVGNADTRFQEDALRILRALRFASIFNFRIEDTTSEAIHRNKELLRNIAVERIQVELTKTLCGPGIAHLLHDYSDVIAIPIPEISPMIGFEQHNPHHDKDVWAHTIQVVASTPADPVLRWTALLHDIGKPHCFSLADDGVGHFYGHAEKSTELTKCILDRLRFDNASKDRISTLVRYHDLPIAAEKKPVKRLMSKLGADTVRQLIEVHKADTKGQSDICQYRIEEYEEVSKVLDTIFQEASCFSLKDLAINGNDLLAHGMRGPAIGAALENCLVAVIEEKIQNDKEALLQYVFENLTTS